MLLILKNINYLIINIKYSKKMKLKLLLILTRLINYNNAETEAFFSKQDNCTDQIIKNILSAEKEILVEAYSFTSHKIIEALIKQKEKGINIIIIEDFSQVKNKKNHTYNNLIYLSQNGINIFIKKNKQNGLQHNKVIIIDKKILFTGSFNFTQAAENKNDENLLRIDDKKIINKFINNFYILKNQSTPL